MQKKNFSLAVAIICVAVAIFVVRSAFTSGVPQGADSFAAADKNGDGSLDKAEFVSFVKAAKLGTPASDSQKAGVKICPKTGKVCKHSAEGGMEGEGGCCGGEGMSMKGEGGCFGGEGMGMKGEGGCCGGEGMGMKGGAKGKAGMKSCCSGEGAADEAGTVDMPVEGAVEEGAEAAGEVAAEVAVREVVHEGADAARRGGEGEDARRGAAGTAPPSPPRWPAASFAFVNPCLGEAPTRPGGN